MMYNDFLGLEEDQKEKRYKRMAQQQAMEPQREVASSEPMDMGDISMNTKSAAQAGSNAAARGSSAMDTLSSAGMASGHPAIMAASLGAKVIADKKARERAEQQRLVNQAIERRNRVAQMMSSLGEGIGSIG